MTRVVARAHGALVSMAGVGMMVVGGVGLGAGLVGCDDGPESGVAFTPTVAFGEVGAGPGQFSYPRSLDVEEREGATLIWVVDKLARIQCIDADTGASVGSFRTLVWELGKPTGITAWRSRNAAFDPTIGGVEEGARTLLFVADTHYHRVLVYDAASALKAGETSPEPMLRFGAYGKGPGEMIYPTDVAVLEDERGGIARLYVSEYGSNDRISVYTPKGATIDEGFEFAWSFGTFGAGGDPKVVEFNRPQSVEIDAQRGWLVVTDACNHRVGVFTLEGEPIRWMGEYEPGEYGPDEGDIAVSSADAADVVARGASGGAGSADAGSAASGAQSAGAQSAGAQSAGAHSSRVRLRYPYGLALRSDGTAVVCEFGSSRVHLIDLERGASLGTFGVRGTGPGELAAPWSVGLARSERWVLVLDSGNNRVQGFELGPMVREPGARRAAADTRGSGTP